MNEKEIEDINKIPEEELDKIYMLKMTLEKAKALNSLEKQKEEIIKQVKETYAQKMFYEFLKDTIKKLYAEDVIKINKITEILNKTSYTNLLRKYMDLFSGLADSVSIDVFDNVLSINYYIEFNDFFLHFARIELNVDDNGNSKIMLGYMFDEMKDITAINKEELLTYLIKFMANLEEKIQEKYQDP